MIFASTSAAVVDPSSCASGTAGEDFTKATAVDKHHRAGRKMSSEPP
eukprot:CAMPEP_0118820550 /NCGR_PEP_ID=MMETSP1162-20130426/7798_1 /TAXON_ID=33656 /ORGANISM="Phaeocystis Sp, Strain CCMP2710" /LENGTH=46 /DNA_ID= /DNA_START= /DNA_END= /DNA_ORIENTATION=